MFKAFVVNTSDSIPIVVASNLFGKDGGGRCNWDWEGETTHGLILEGTQFYLDKDNGVWRPNALSSDEIKSAMGCTKNVDAEIIDEFFEKYSDGVESTGIVDFPPTVEDDIMVESTSDPLPVFSVSDVNAIAGDGDTHDAAIRKILGDGWKERLNLDMSNDQVERLEKAFTKILLLKKDLPVLNTPEHLKFKIRCVGKMEEQKLQKESYCCESKESNCQRSKQGYQD